MKNKLGEFQLTVMVIRKDKKIFRLFRLEGMNSCGFSLVEIMIVISIFSILAAIAIPNFISWLPNFRLKSAARDLYSTMQKVRLEAVKRNTNVGISFSTVAFPAEGGSYLVFIDDGAGTPGNAGNAVQDAGEATLLQTNLPTSCSLTSASFSGNPWSGYNSEGLPLGNRIGSVELRNSQSRWYKISLSNSGHVRLEISSDGANWN
ncbi:MAG: GspH/FimT family pseudopilin [Candidatus Brocadiales bacterium]|nr:GspH/FimT family pseudopilin [Candidatus Brocadiales bacterium]